MTIANHPLSPRKSAVIAGAAKRLCDGLEALENAAQGAENQHIGATPVLWFCRVLKRDALLCLRATDPNETEDDLEGMAR